MPEKRGTLAQLETQTSPQTDKHKTAVLRVLVNTPKKGYQLNEIAAEAAISKRNVYRALQPLRKDNLVEQRADHYLVNPERVTEIKHMVFTSQQLAVAADISQEDTTSSSGESDPVSIDDLAAPPVDNLME